MKNIDIHSICDGVAAQVKGTLNVTVRDEQTVIKTPDKAVTIIEKLNNHKTSLVQPALNDFSTNTLKEIKQFFKFQANSGKNMIYAFKDSLQQKYDKQFQPHEVLELTDIMLQ